MSARNTGKGCWIRICFALPQLEWKADFNASVPSWVVFTFSGVRHLQSLPSVASGKTPKSGAHIVSHFSLESCGQESVNCYVFSAQQRQKSASCQRCAAVLLWIELRAIVETYREITLDLFTETICVERAVSRCVSNFLLCLFVTAALGKSGILLNLYNTLRKIVIIFYFIKEKNCGICTMVDS